MKFILNRTNDRATMPKKRILLLAIAWFVVLFLISAAIIIGMTMIYRGMGVDPDQLTNFGGHFINFMDRPFWYISMILLIAPVVEEIIFRLGLSFNRQTAALWMGRPSTVRYRSTVDCGISRLAEAMCSKWPRRCIL